MGELAGPAGAVSGQLAAYFYDAQGELLAVTPAWTATDYAQPDEAVRQAGAVHHAVATQLRLATTVTLDEGWLDFSALRLQTAGEPLPVVSGQTYSITVQLSGELPLAETGRLLLLTDGIPTLIWQNEAGYQGQNTVISHTFTAAPNANAVHLLVEAPLAGGWLAVEETVLVRVITRSTYMLAGQVTAVRVSGDPDPANDGLFYLYADHLGSTSAMTDPNGSLVGEVVRYYPFGGYRTAPTARQSAISDRGFTGHKSGENGGSNDIGLIYMNARFFIVGISRFASADTLVPNPTNPQSYNRYSYVLNSSLNFRDPSGHNPVCNHDGSICSDGAYDDGKLDRRGDTAKYEQSLLDSAYNFHNGYTNAGPAFNAISMLPYVDTADDVSTFLTGCGLSCQAGYEEPVGWGWRTVAGVGILLPFGVRSIRTIGDVLGSVDQYADEALSFITSSDRLILFRGLKADDSRLADYLQTGIVYPKGGSSSLYGHVQDGFTDSIYTSWTLDAGLAYERAMDDAGNFGAILMVDNSQIPNAQFASFRWSQYDNEWEITTEGPIWDWVQIFDSSPSK